MFKRFWNWISGQGISTRDYIDYLCEELDNVEARAFDPDTIEAIQAGKEFTASSLETRLWEANRILTLRLDYAREDINLLANAMGVEFKTTDSKDAHRKLVKKSKKK